MPFDLIMNFMRFKWFYFLLSALVILPGIFSLVKYGLRPSVDFTGGSVWELKFKESAVGEKLTEVAAVLRENKMEVNSLQLSGEKQVLIKMKPVDKEEISIAKAALAKELEEMPEEIRFETVGPVLGTELVRKTIIAVSLASLVILFYIAWQFKDLMFGACAILGMFHDTLVMLGIFSLLGHYYGVEVDTLFVTAMLTILSFSVHDTVVVYDRVRESQKRYPKVAFAELVNKAVTETLPRSINNSMTIIFMLIALWLLGGETIKWFAFALLVGTISGTYSSTFTSAPLLVVWQAIKSRRKFAN